MYVPRVPALFEALAKFPSVLVNLRNLLAARLTNKGVAVPFHSRSFDQPAPSHDDAAARDRVFLELRVLMAPLLQSLPAEDRLLLKLHFWDGLSMAAISPLLGRPQRELYTVRDKCLKKLRRNLEEAGLSSERIRTLLGCSRLDLTRGDL